MRFSVFLVLAVGCGQKLEATTVPCSDELQCLAPDGLSDCEDCEPVCQEDHLPTEDRRHLEGPIDYAVKPPAGGPHNPCWHDWGVFDTEVEDERWVHNQEHGAVVFLYNCPDGCEGELQALIRAVADKERVIISPYSEMRWRFAASAWEHRIMMNCLDADRMVAFYDAHFAKAPEDVSSMAPDGCMDEEESDSGGNESDTGESESDTGESESGTGTAESL